MLFLLKHLHNDSIFYLNNKDSFLIGRKECDLLIKDDQSISRKHAIIIIKGDKIVLMDFGSRYKTLHNHVELKTNTEYQLKANDIIKFGVFNSEYRFEAHQLLTSGTKLKNYVKEKIKTEIKLLGGEYSEIWHDGCTHLTVEEINITIKVLQAIVDGKPIVKPSYWTQLLENVKGNVDLLDASKYIPPMSEALLNKIELNQNINRDHLFDGKIFVFAKEKNRKSFDDVIKKTGGISCSWEKNPMSIADVLNSPKDILVMLTPEKEDNLPFSDLIQIMKKNGKRAIPLQELALAIVLGNCEKNCNPYFSRTNEVFKNSHTKETEYFALVQGTQSENCSKESWKLESEKIVADTFEKSLLPPAGYSGRSNVGEINTCEIELEAPIDCKKRPAIDSDLETQNDRNKKFKSEKSQEDGIERSNENNFLTKPVASKRKAVDLPVPSSNKVNAFLAISKKQRTENKPTNRNNPFSKIGETSDVPVAIRTENPFIVSVKQEDDKVKQLKCCDRTNNSVNNNYSNSSIAYSKKSNYNNTSYTSWLNKKSINSKGNESLYTDTNIQEFVDLFEGIVIEADVLSTYSFRQRTSDDVKHNKSHNLNFKKFRKQNRSIRNSRSKEKIHYTTIDPESTEEIPAVTISGFDDFDDQIKERLVERKKPPKRFNI